MEAKIQHIDTSGEYDNLIVNTNGIVTMSSWKGADVVFYRVSRDEIQAMADVLYEWLEVN